MILAARAAAPLDDHHAPYITWEEFERDQGVIANNATGKGSAAVKGAVRRGDACPKPTAPARRRRCCRTRPTPQSAGSR